MENFLEKTLGELLNNPNQIIRNNAMSIFKQLQRSRDKQERCGEEKRENESKK